MKAYSTDKGEQVRGTVTSTSMSYLMALANIAQPPKVRAREAFENHAWVFAAALASAWNLSQAPFQIYNERPDTVDARRTSVIAKGRKWHGPQAGDRRRAMLRHAQQRGRFQGMSMKALEQDPEHPLSGVLHRPCDTTSSSQMLWFITTLWYKIRGEAFWILTDEEGVPCSWFENPAQIHPASPDLFTEILSENRLAGWRFRADRGYGFGGIGRFTYLNLDQVVHFKLYNPNYPVRGISPITAVASGIYNDMLSNDSNRGLLENGSEPGGVLYHDGEKGAFKSDKERTEFTEAWKQRHEGSGKSRRVSILTGGWKYAPIGLTPKDMDFLNAKQWNRSEILAVMQTPQSVLSVTDNVPYAVSISQDRNFWDKGLLPNLRYFEQTFDSTVMSPYTDDALGLFDLSNVEALRVGLADKVDTAIKLMGDKPHMPPADAYDLVGLVAPDYLARDTAMVSQGQVPVEWALDPASLQPAPAPTPTAAPAPAREEEKPPVGDGGTAGNEPAEPKVRARKASKWSSLINNVQAPAERKMKRLWRDWVDQQRLAQLKRFDEVVSSEDGLEKMRSELRGAPWLAVTKDHDDLFPYWEHCGLETVKTKSTITDVMLDIDSMRKSLRDKFRPAYLDEKQSVWDFTVEELGGVAVINYDDARLQRVLDRRENILVGNAPDTLQTSMRESLREGVELGETVNELRERVGATYAYAASSMRALCVARTESAGFMNEVREQMFAAEGFKAREWTTAQDAHVRDSHRKFGAAGPKDSGFNYLSLVGKSGTLEYPSDPRAPGSETINCRCAAIPVDKEDSNEVQ
jgi:phage portal protein BeeE